MIFAWRRLRCEFRAAGRLEFHACAAVTLRGALGFALAGDPQLYQAFFSPAITTGPSGLRTPPRPFVLRARHLDSAIVEPGTEFHFLLHLFGRDSVVPLQTVLHRMAAAGLGEHRVPLQWIGLQEELQTCVLAPEQTPVETATVSFLSPISLKPLPATAVEIPFAVLFARARDRVSTLLSFYGNPGPLPDFRALGTIAAGVRTHSSALTPVRYDRRSARTGQSHPLAGVTGWARYASPDPDVLPQLLPWLHAAQFCGVGRHTVWGMGEIAVRSNA